jgi:hypothetical protein
MNPDQICPLVGNGEVIAMANAGVLIVDGQAR